MKRNGEEKISEEFDKYVSRGMAGAESIKDSLSDFTTKVSHDVENSVNKGIKHLKNVSENTEALVKKYPLYAIAGAATVSFLAGMIYGKISNRD